MAYADAREEKWRGNWRMELVASTLHTTSEHDVSSITTADAHSSAASSRLNWRPRRFKWTRPFRRKTKSGFCACAITFQTQSTLVSSGGRGGGKGGRADIIATFMSDYLEILRASTFRSLKGLSRQVMVSFTFDVFITKYQTGFWGSLQGPVLSNLKHIASKFLFVLTSRLRTKRKTMKRIYPKFSNTPSYHFI